MAPSPLHDGGFSRERHASECGRRYAQVVLELAAPERAPHHAARTSETRRHRSEEHTSELQSLMRISYAVFCLKKKKKKLPCTYDITRNQQPLKTNNTKT